MNILDILRDTNRDDVFDVVFRELSSAKDKRELTAEELKIYYIAELGRELFDGSFNDYFYNESGSNVIKTQEALMSIGAVEILEILRTAIKEFPDKFPYELKARQKVLEEMEDEFEDVWLELEDEFLDCYDEFIDLLIWYVKEKKDNF